MKYVMCGFAIVALAAIVGAGFARAEEDEEGIAIADLPAAVTDAIKAEYPDAELLEAEKETEEGTTTYEVEIKNDGKLLEVEVSPEGEILGVEAEGDDEGDDDGK